MTDSERQKMMLDIEYDLKAIAENEKYLLYKFRKLSVRGKENVIMQLNIALKSDLEYPERPEDDKTKVLFNEYGVTTDAYFRLPFHIQAEINDCIYELFKLEPSYKGKRCKIGNMYKRLSPLSKRIASERINKLLNSDIEDLKKQETSMQSDSKTAVVIDFQSKKAVNKGASL
ncbi:hypothetical protein [Lutispora thermophila]|uniref:Uncharacterized protein n=1 Tax=Lutispora thermophila DSM 19022 TaxID=1122184 RepID=A0A1M6EEY9_9FIRM|nr:hypothetical protein [Lutispora thermophila]SHI84025.1 hypothetical protein SAMN02745176_01529 [Lutispora thermophila DSM 19022]